MKYYQINNSGFEVTEDKSLCALVGTTPQDVSYIFVDGKATHCSTPEPVLLMRASAFLHQMNQCFYNTDIYPDDQDLVVLISDQYSADSFFEEEDIEGLYRVYQVGELRNKFTEFLKFRDDNNIPTLSELESKYGRILSRAFSYSTLPWMSGNDGYITHQEFKELLYNTKEMDVYYSIFNDNMANDYMEYVPTDKSISVKHYPNNNSYFVRCTHNECEVDIED